MRWLTPDDYHVILSWIPAVRATARRLGLRAGTDRYDEAIAHCYSLLCGAVVRGTPITNRAIHGGIMDSIADRRISPVFKAVPMSTLDTDESTYEPLSRHTSPDEEVAQREVHRILREEAFAAASQTAYRREHRWSIVRDILNGCDPGHACERWGYDRRFHLRLLTKLRSRLISRGVTCAA